MSYYAAQIANEFIRRGLDDGVTIDPLKIQKLVYLAHGWNLAFLKTPLIREEIEAWRYGPVVPELYRQFRNFRYSTIDKQAPVPSDAPRLDDQAEALLNEVWRKYGHISGVELSVLSHEPGYAWDLTRRSNGEGWVWTSPNIPNEWIRDEFERRLSKG